jgi:hypothetical protein
VTSLGLSLTDASYQEAVRRTALREFRDRGTILYKRRHGVWERRTSHSQYVDHWERAKRVPRAVREAARPYTTGDVEVEFETKDRTAVARERWRWA